MQDSADNKQNNASEVSSDNSSGSAGKAPGLQDESSTESVTRSLYDSLFTTRDGRRYHANADSVYSLPNDDVMLDIQDDQHKLWLNIFQRLQFTPIESPKRALDCGTGTGAWAIAFATQHEDCEVLGVDLSPVQHSDYCPRNVNFECDNILTGLRHKEESFDLIHSRNISLGITDWTVYLTELRRMLAPQGWVSILEKDLYIYNTPENDTCPINQLLSRLGHCFEELGLRTAPRESIVAALRQLSFRDVQVKIVDVPIGDITGSEETRQNSLDAMQMWMPLFTTLGDVLKRTDPATAHAEIDLLCANARTRLNILRGAGLYMRLNIIIAQK